MTKGFHKKQSKRVTCRKKYKIDKNVKAHNRKLRKQAKKSTLRKGKPKDIGVPNSLPFKEEVIREAEQHLQQQAERKELIRSSVKQKQGKARSKLLDERRGIDTSSQSKGTLESLAKDAEKRNKEFNKQGAKATGSGSMAGVSNLSSHYKEFMKVVEIADVILEVVDARDPLGTRCPEVEEAVLNAGANKKLVIVVNKVDLIPRENLQNWMTYLRNELPTVAFKASTQNQRENLSRSNKDILSSSEDLLSSNKCLGAKMLMKLLGNYCRSQGIKTAIRVGVVGFPNVGKSSVINSLKRSRACSVGATPGLTKSMQEVSLDKHIKLLDCPGIVFAKANQTNNLPTEGDSSQMITSLMALRNAIKIETLDDPITPVEAILCRVKKEDMMIFYRLPNFSDSGEFLSLLAKRFGKLKKGGVPDVLTAARKVLNDWNLGRIKYYTLPPETYTMSTHISAEIVASLSAGFQLDAALKEEEMKEIDEGLSKKVMESVAICIPSLGLTSGDQGMTDDKDMDGDTKAPSSDEDEQEGEEMTVDDNQGLLGATQIQMVATRSKTRAKLEVKDVEMKDAEGASLMKGMQMNKDKKLLFKKMKKQKKRQSKVADNLASSLDTNIGLGDDDEDEPYDFSSFNDK